MEAQQHELWQDNESSCSLMCAALHSAAKVGNVTFAATLLDLMQKRGKVLNALDWNQGIDACTTAGAAGAAMYLFQQMISAGVQPNLISFSLIAGASAKNLTQISEAERLFEESDVEPDSGSFEELVCALLRARQLKMNTGIRAQNAEAAIRNVSLRRKAEAWRVIQQAEAKGMGISNLLQVFKAALLKDPHFLSAGV